MEFGSFPKNLAYNVKTLSGFSKTICKLTPTPNSAVSAGQTLKVRLPSNALLDLRTLTMYYEGTCTNTGGSGTGYLRFPRLSSSIIDTLNIYINGTLIENITDYGHLYSCLYDLSCAGDQTAKRFLENSDPSILVDNGSTDITCPTFKATAFGAAGGGKAEHATAQPFYINNWLGFIGSSSTNVIDSNDCGVIELEIRLKPKEILWATNGNATGTVANLSNPNYSIDNVVFTIQKIVFNDPLYYNMKSSKLLGDGFTIGYNTYICSKSSSQAKGTSMNIQANINTTSLDQLICTTAPNDANANHNLLLQTAGGADANMLTFNQAKSGVQSNPSADPFNTGIALASVTIDAAGILCTAADIRVGDTLFVSGAFGTGLANLTGLSDVNTVVSTMWYKVSAITAGTAGTPLTVGAATKFTVNTLGGVAVTYTAGTGATTGRFFTINRGSSIAPIVGYINQTVAGYNDYTSGDLFNQSVAYRRNLMGLLTSSVEINNVPITPIPLKPAEVFNETLIALGNANLDMSAGVHEGCFSLAQFLKYYGTHIVSLENIQSDSFYKSGLDGKSSALNINWKPSFSGNVETIIPIIYCKTTRFLIVNEGLNITVVV
jgi:hypothetical protein